MGNCNARNGSATGSQDGPAVESVICNINDLTVGQLSEFELGEGKEKVMVAKLEDGSISALSGRCTHYGAPLVKGAVSSDGATVRCQWHGACFSLKTGDLEDYPGLDSLYKHETSVDGEGQVKVRIRKEFLKSKKRIREMCKKSADNDETVAVVGGGAAAQACVETLRQDGFTGRVVMVSKEPARPYDRPKLSKSLGSTAEDIALRPLEFYQDHSIELHLGDPVESVNFEDKVLTTNKGENINYDHLVIATGGKPRTLQIPGSDLENVKVLRDPNDANGILKAAQEKNVVIIGSSFIGMEVAAFLVSKKVDSVTVVGTSSVPFKNILGEEIGRALMNLHIQKGVKFVMEDSPKEFVSNGGDDAKLTGVLLSSGHTLPADVVLLGVGVTPSTDFLQNSSSNLEFDKYGHIKVDEHLKSGVDSVYAAGDVALFPMKVASGAAVSVGHWQMASSHGRTVAKNIINECKQNIEVKDKDNLKVKSIPFFWSQQYGKSLRYAGHSSRYDSIEIDGNVEELNFAAYFCEGDNVKAIATMNRDPLAAKFANLLADGCKKLTKDSINNW